jgi:hypothetical protein
MIVNISGRIFEELVVFLISLREILDFLLGNFPELKKKIKIFFYDSKTKPKVSRNL